MQCMILAAEKESRFGLGVCKTLLPIGGRTILDQIIENVKDYVNSVRIVVGYQKQKIKDKLYMEHPWIKTIVNPVWESTNTGFSFVLGLENCPDGDLLWINGDLIFDKKILDFLVEIDTPYNLVAVRIGETDSEDMKVVLDNSGKVKQFGKRLQKAHGEAIGMGVIRQAHRERLAEEMRRKFYKNKTAYYEDLFNFVLEEIPFLAVNVKEEVCLDINTYSDYLAAISLLT